MAVNMEHCYDAIIDTVFGKDLKLVRSFFERHFGQSSTIIM